MGDLIELPRQQTVEAEAAELAERIKELLLEYPPGSLARLQCETALARYEAALALRRVAELEAE